ncbi:hypothetical protein JJQ59_10680 [Cupriavidus necator]|uniref:hypothetical protein n=1 Tax=Cupriavidus necator TaxID=106590 RepID=UPI0016782F68|nr:hypothetical protein [Cupriavidus necator]QQX82939.1 hypothetical protein JJQ59_10680 [Cupriavidus necator]
MKNRKSAGKAGNRRVWCAGRHCSVSGAPHAVAVQNSSATCTANVPSRLGDSGITLGLAKLYFLVRALRVNSFSRKRRPSGDVQTNRFHHAKRPFDL